MSEIIKRVARASDNTTEVALSEYILNQMLETRAN